MSALTPRRGRRTLMAGAALAIAASLAIIPAPAAHAATVFKVIGTADVFDSRLVQNVIEPRFEAAYPQYDFQYTTGGTGKAIAQAETGSHAAMIVHAAALENQFVAAGYSTEPYGRAVFWGDYVLLAPPGDPAGVLNGSTHDIVTALEKVASAGEAGTADFASRGGTPGTSVQERYLWSLSNVPGCNVSAGNGGGRQPSTSSGDCPSNIDTTPLPAWYHINAGASQADNITQGNACVYPGRSGKCYVFTDRGTFNYLQSTTPAGGLSLTQAVRDNDPSARGGLEALINAFHAYSVNPAKFGSPGGTDPVAAKLFLDFLTSPTTQTAIGQYLNGTADPPFIPSAAPKLTGAFQTTVAETGKKVTVAGNIKNVVPGTPVLSGVPFKLFAAPAGQPLAVPTQVASGVTDATGNYSIAAGLEGGQTYRVAVDDITKIERPDLDPIFGDILTGTSTSVGAVAGVVLKRPKHLHSGKTRITGKVTPAAKGGSTVQLWGAKKGKKLHRIGKAVTLKDGRTKVKITKRFKAGKWKLQLVYTTPGALTGATAVKTVRLR